MPQLTRPVVNIDEMRLTVLFGTGRNELHRLSAAGQSVPRPVACSALIDTACSLTSISGSLLAPFNLAVAGSGQTTTASGRLSGRIVLVSMTIEPGHFPPGQALFFPDMPVMELSPPIP
jgi:hypothetical protein